MTDKNEYILLGKAIYASLTGTELNEAEENILPLKVNSIFKKLRDNIEDEVLNEYKALIAYTAALMTALDICRQEKSLFMKPIKIGDITMGRAIGSEGLEAIIKANFREMSPILSDNNFIFKIMEV